MKECFELLGPIAISFAHDSWFITHHHLASSLSKLSSTQVYGSIILGSSLYKNLSAQLSNAVESSAELVLDLLSLALVFQLTRSAGFVVPEILQVPWFLDEGCQPDAGFRDVRRKAAAVLGSRKKYG